jgi:hypothetical protein
MKCVYLPAWSVLIHSLIFFVLLKDYEMLLDVRKFENLRVLEKKKTRPIICYERKQEETTETEYIYI